MNPNSNSILQTNFAIYLVKYDNYSGQCERQPYESARKTGHKVSVNYRLLIQLIVTSSKMNTDFRHKGVSNANQNSPLAHIQSGQWDL